MAKHYRWFAISVAALCVMSILPAEQSAAANTLCVNPKGSKGCYSTISAGVAAANSGDTVRVGQGTYREHVIINKPLSLIGFNAANTIIDASGNTGNGVGIYVDGMDNLTAADIAASQLTGLSDVVVQGFTVANGGFEGILVTNESNVTITENQVTGNNTNLKVPATLAVPLFLLGKPAKVSTAARGSISTLSIIRPSPTTKSTTMPAAS